jgi:5'-3' exonuclease
MRRNNIHCVFIYDTGAPPEKQGEREERAQAREKLEQKIYNLEDALDHYHKTSEILPILIEFNKKRKSKSDFNMKRLLRKEEAISIPEITQEIEKIKNQAVHISSDDFKITKILFDILKVPYFQAPLEAETMCSDLCIRKQVDAVISEDTDVLAYSSPIFLTKLNTQNDTCVEINYEHIIESLEITSDQFLDLCIMCGTDYNKNIYKVGPEKAFKLLKEHGTIDDLLNKNVLDISVLKHKRGRELFREYTKSNVEIAYCGDPDIQQLQEFIHKYNVRINLQSFYKSCAPAKLVFDEEDS